MRDDNLFVDVVEVVDVVDDLCVGVAAEHIVCADLLMQGYRAFRTDQFCAYDVAVEHDGRIVKVQVKGTRGLRAVPQRRNQTDAYLFHLRRAGKGGKRRYGSDEFDVVALVALDIKRIAYFKIGDLRDVMHLLAPGHEKGYQYTRRGNTHKLSSTGCSTRCSLFQVSGRSLKRWGQRCSG